MSEISKQRLIDGDKVLDWLGNLLDVANAMFALEQRSLIERMMSQIKSGRFDAPSDQGEAARLREALTEVFNLLEEHQPDWYLGGHYRQMKQALSSHTEDTRTQMDDKDNAMLQVLYNRYNADTLIAAIRQFGNTEET